MYNWSAALSKVEQLFPIDAWNDPHSGNLAQEEFDHCKQSPELALCRYNISGKVMPMLCQACSLLSSSNAAGIYYATSSPGVSL